MSESTFSDDTAGGEGSSYAADVDAGYDDETIGGVAGATDDGSATGGETSRAADVDAGYDDPADSPASGDDVGTSSS